MAIKREQSGLLANEGIERNSSFEMVPEESLSSFRKRLWRREISSAVTGGLNRGRGC